MTYYLLYPIKIITDSHVFGRLAVEDFIEIPESFRQSVTAVTIVMSNLQANDIVTFQ